MQITLYSVGTKLDGWVQQQFDEYAKRLSTNHRLVLKELPAERRSNNQSSAKYKQKETEKLAKAISANSYVVALDEYGKHWSTLELSEKLNNWQQNAQPLALILGGADGLDFAELQKENPSWPHQKWSLSKLTFPHPLVRVIVAEQLYRAATVLTGHPYHRI